MPAEVWVEGIWRAFGRIGRGGCAPGWAGRARTEGAERPEIRARRAGRCRPEVGGPEPSPRLFALGGAPSRPAARDSAAGGPGHHHCPDHEAR